MKLAFRVSTLVLVVALASMLRGLAVAPTTSAQTGPRAEVSQVDSAAFPDVTAVVTVLGPGDRPIVGLSAAQFQAFADGTPLDVRRVDAAVDIGIGMAVVLVMDASGSMDGRPIEQAKKGAQTFVESLSPNDKVAVIAFADQVSTVQDFTSDPAAAREAIAGLLSRGDSAVYDAVVIASQLAASSALPRKAVIMLTDGENFGETSATREQSLAEAERLGVPIITVGLGEFVDPAYLSELSTRTGGIALLAPSPEELTGLYNTIGSILRSQYVVEIDATAAPETSPLTLRIEVETPLGRAVTEGSFARPLPPPVPPPAPPPLAQASQPEAAEEGGGPSYALLVIPVAAASVLVAGFVFYRRRRRHAAGASGPGPGWKPGPPAPLPVATQPPVADDEVLARLILQDGAAGRKAFPLTRRPATLGSDASCEVVLADRGHRVAAEQARVWYRDGKFMLHKLSRRGITRVAGREVAWAVLEDGDLIEVGPFQLLFQSLPTEGRKL